MPRLPLFVLPTVLFPGQQQPLHVFEPRYRQMVARCLEYDKRFGVLFHRRDVYGPFRIEPGRVGCVAEIRHFRPLPDGRSLLLARGVGRFEILDGVDSDTTYHEALVGMYRDAEDEAGAELGRRRQRSIALFEAVLRGLPQTEAFEIAFDPARETSFRMAARIEIDAAWQQELLEIRRESERLDRVDEVLRAALNARRGPS